MVALTTDENVRATGRRANRTRAERAGYVPPFRVVTRDGWTRVEDAGGKSPFSIRATDGAAAEHAAKVACELNNYGEIRESADA